MALPPIPDSWRGVLADAVAAPSYQRLQAFLAEERAAYQVFPPEPEVFSALALTPFERVWVVVVGQDPYHDDGQAHGLAFSVRPGVPLPPSLRNIFQERRADVGCAIPANGSLVGWARQGVLLLNTVLTVRAHAAGSHRRKGWEPFTDAVIRAVGARQEPAVFVLWGAPAQAKRELVEPGEHVVVASPHPSPLSARRGFFGSAPFSQINAALQAWGQPPIDWCRSEG
jgi:uracil-DNA glycosylase